MMRYFSLVVSLVNLILKKIMQNTKNAWFFFFFFPWLGTWDYICFGRISSRQNGGSEDRIVFTHIGRKSIRKTYSNVK